MIQGHDDLVYSNEKNADIFAENLETESTTLLVGIASLLYYRVHNTNYQMLKNPHIYD